MASYRVFFRNARAGIQGRDDFTAANDHEAMILARLIFEACSDACSEFELWEGARLVDKPQSRPAPVQLAAAAINQETQRSLIEREEAIQSSGWAIGNSRRLLGTLDHLKTRSQIGRRN
jgi:hypothetical protein